MQKKTKVYVGMDVHKDTVMIAVLAEGAREPTVVKRLSSVVSRKSHDIMAETGYLSSHPPEQRRDHAPGTSVEGARSQSGRP